jgi:hypothetical protein
MEGKIIPVPRQAKKLPLRHDARLRQSLTTPVKEAWLIGCDYLHGG